MNKVLASVGLAVAGIAVASLAACSGGSPSPGGGSAQSIMDAESNPAYTSVPLSDLLNTPFPAADVSSTAAGVTIGNGPDTNQLIAVLTPAGLKDPVIATQENTAKTAGITVSVNGSVLTETGPISEFMNLP